MNDSKHNLNDWRNLFHLQTLLAGRMPDGGEMEKYTGSDNSSLKLHAALDMREDFSVWRWGFMGQFCLLKLDCHKL